MTRMGAPSEHEYRDRLDQCPEHENACHLDASALHCQDAERSKPQATPRAQYTYSG